MEVSQPAASPTLPSWARELITAYESGAASQFILSGNVDDRIILPLATGVELGSITDFISRVLLPTFDVVLAYDLGQGTRVEKGGELLAQWPTFKAGQSLPREPRAAVEFATHYFRFAANLARLGKGGPRVGLFMRAAALVAPAFRGGLSFELSALASQIRDWGSDPLIADHHVATFLITPRISDLNPIISESPRAARIAVPLPAPSEIAAALLALAPRHARAVNAFGGEFAGPADMLAGATLHSVESLLKTREHTKAPITIDDLSALRRELVERENTGLIDFIEPDRTLDDVHAQEKVKAWLRQDVALWKANDLRALPMGYLFCGPVGTGKTYMVECLAGEAGVPVVKLKNFRDRWVGSTEGNLETIFRLLHALGRCIVFIDEADQALGRRQAESGDSGVGGRVYSMIAEEMSNTRNRGRIMWVLASSRPDLIEVDLKRPGRIDVKIPLFPTTEPAAGFALLRALCRKRDMPIETSDFEAIEKMVPNLLTPGAAEAVAVKAYRAMRTGGMPPLDALKSCLVEYRHPVPADVMEFQIGLALREATDIDFIPAALRNLAPSTG